MIPYYDDIILCRFTGWLLFAILPSGTIMFWTSPLAAMNFCNLWSSPVPVWMFTSNSLSWRLSMSCWKLGMFTRWLGRHSHLLRWLRSLRWPEEVHALQNLAIRGNWQLVQAMLQEADQMMRVRQRGEKDTPLEDPIDLHVRPWVIALSREPCAIHRFNTICLVVCSYFKL